MTDIETLREAVRTANKALGKAEAKQRAAEHAKLIGKCFKERNNYSCPGKRSDYWYVYYKIVGTDGYSLLCEQFQTDKNGHVRIELTKNYRMNMNCAQPISHAEYKRAWQKLRSRINAYDPAWPAHD